jgi:hypothetical protein
MESKVQLLLNPPGKWMTLGVVQFNVKGFQSPQYGQTDSAGSNRSNVHTFEIVRTRDTIRDVPSAVPRDLMSRQVVANQRQNHHHSVFGDANTVRKGLFGYRDTGFDGRVQVHVVGADPCRDGEFQFLRFPDPICSKVGGPKRLRDDDIRIREFPFEDGIWPVLVGGDDKMCGPNLRGTSADPVLRIHSRATHRG